tara:strand:- start:16 stop:468 length:453 start_codon:yes stop_codon:yes gene_type:complete
MIFNKKFLHAIEAVLDISIYSSHSPTRASEITKRQGIPSRYLEKILQELVRHSILKGTRGPNGGYTLGREKRNIFLIDIYGAILEMEKINNKKKKITNTPIRSKIINPFISKSTNELINSFKSTSIYDLHKNFGNIQSYIDKEKKIDFTI